MLATILSLLLDASTSPKPPSPWDIVLVDYQEFCADTTLTWDLNRGTLRTARGGCGTNSKAPAIITIAELKPADLRKLRILSEQALDRGISARPCNRPPVFMSGPIGFSIQRGSRKTDSSHCLNRLGLRVETAIGESIDRK